MSTDAIPLMPLRDKSPARRNENNPRSSGWLKTRALHAWRVTIASGALAALVILLINIITIAVICAKYPMSGNGVAFYTGSCETTKVVTTVAHLIINILSTILLAYSNFAMQCLNSPTRAEVDAAHAKQHWLNIGTPSIRNLFFISRSKLCLWLVLGLSSLPLHMLWNSTVFDTQSTNDYLAVAVTPDFANGPEWTTAESQDLFASPANETTTRYREMILGLQQKMHHHELEHLSVDVCQQAYFTSVIPNRSNVLLVVGDSSATSPVVAIWDNQYIADDGYTYAWTRCYGSNCFSMRPYNPDFGSATIGPVRECYSQKTAEQCKASVAPVFLIIVIICNVIKTCCFILTLRITKPNPPLCTLGDAVQSFLKEPDIYTQRRCLVSKKDYDSHLLGKSHEWGSRPTNIGDTWAGGRDRWFRSVNKLQFVLFSLSLIAIAIVGVACIGLSGTLVDIPGFPTPLAFVGKLNTVFGLGQASMFTACLVANIPQVLISYIYLGLNNVMTTMLVMHEWCSYSASSRKAAKGLRVTSPVPESAQRSTYFLSLPYKWSIPITLVLTLIHWLVSVMFTFVQLDVHRIDSGATVTAMNYVLFWRNVLILVLPIGLGAYGILFLLSLFKKFPGAMPLAGCCSASIAAACQPSLLHGSDLRSIRAFPPDLSNRKLKWGVVERPEEMENGIGHATFSDETVTPLEKEKMYN
ncbi:unnamed protein product [Penicillium nalgiovense]|uniref:DUF6536 domain-containing protein n=1 Tax=Penicillium nalgiovense TaxID=60175 RepID=A0A9W4HG62_PENNA|nr:unnamed protein product [Penicillium nalgiovense]CAG7949395.1 unnamed protein product [Penicillium nalgiovense]CAG7975828.1 unnamed protein product [Penicillium nalgiovense]CAG7990305.1 unnamed protein product [Penicillium nalgiovense]CAG8014369.1 unnamed protein product [Penicillium nalgiovense]